MSAYPPILHHKVSNSAHKIKNPANPQKNKTEQLQISHYLSCFKNKLTDAWCEHGMTIGSLHVSDIHNDNSYSCISNSQLNARSSYQTIKQAKFWGQQNYTMTIYSNLSKKNFQGPL